MFNVSPSQLNDFRHAAEQAWGDDTRHEGHIGHPDACRGQCFVTSQWLAHKLGGSVGTKRGHYFTVSADKRHVIDLTGDLFSYPPAERAVPQDAEDEPYELDPHQRAHRPGPTMFKRADHPVYKDFRVLPHYPDHERAKLFSRRADAALRGERTGSYHQADLMGADPYPGSTPQFENDHKDINAITLHDEPDYNPDSDLSNHEYKFVWANGHIHVSPIHSHSDLAGHAGHDLDSDGPFAAGHAEVNRGHVLWSISSNIALRGLVDELKSYSDTVGWKFDGVVGPEGEMLSEDFGPKKSMYYTTRKDGHLILSERPLPKGRRISIEGSTAFVKETSPAIEEWARDFGYKLAEYPGGGNMLDEMRPHENLDVFNNGDPNFQPERTNPDAQLPGPVECGACHLPFRSEAELIDHYKNEHQDWEEPKEDGHFPAVEDFDVPLGQHTHKLNDMPGVIAMALPDHRVAARHQRFMLYARLFDYDHDDGRVFYGAYKAGQLIAYGAVRPDGENTEVMMIDSLAPRSGAGTAILRLIETHFDSFYSHADSDAGERLMRRCGMVQVTKHKWRFSKGQEPKDMIEDAIPFMWDHQAKDIKIGYPGEKTRDIPGKFTPGGVIEGYYEPGGKVTILSPNGMLGTSLHSFGRMWYAKFPQMEITSVEHEGPDGQAQKIASSTDANIGPYVKSLAASDPAAWSSFQALQGAGGHVYVVGGAVRDALLGREPKDIDLMVAGLPPEQVAHVLGSLPGRVDLTGKRFGVYRYKTQGHEVEIALPRTDKYESSRRGEGVITVDHNLPVEDDLHRRDFTANSAAVSLNDGKLIDPHGAADDIAANRLRATHADSFAEDPTRLIRALTMHGRYGLIPDGETRSAMEANAHLLKHESPDALNKTLDKLFTSSNPAAGIRLGHDTGVLAHVFPELDKNWDWDQGNKKYHAHVLGEHGVRVLDEVSKLSDDPDLRMAGLLHDIAKKDSAWQDPETGRNHFYRGPNGEGANHWDLGAEQATDIMRRLNYPVARINRVSHYIRHHELPDFKKPVKARQLRARVGDEHVDNLLKLRLADKLGQGMQDPAQARAQYEQQAALVDQSRKNQDPWHLKNLAVNGNDIQQLGAQGPQIGGTLRNLLNDVVNEPMLNNREKLLPRAQTYLNAQPS